MRVAQVTMTLALPYLVFIAGQRQLEVSGVVAAVTAGLTMSAIGQQRISPNDWRFLLDLWEQLAFWASSLIFILAALLVPRMLVNVGWHAVLLLGALAGAATAARGGRRGADRRRQLEMPARSGHGCHAVIRAPPDRSLKRRHRYRAHRRGRTLPDAAGAGRDGQSRTRTGVAQFRGAHRVGPAGRVAAGRRGPAGRSRALRRAGGIYPHRAAPGGLFAALSLRTFPASAL